MSVTTTGDLPDDFENREYATPAPAWSDYQGRILELEINGFRKHAENAVQYGRQWVAELVRKGGRPIALHGRQEHWQLGLGNRLKTAAVALHHGNRAAPVALPLGRRIAAEEEAKPADSPCSFCRPLGLVSL